MTYFEEAYGVYVDAEPHEDAYFAEPDIEDEVGLPEILLAMAALTERQRFVLECRYGLRPGMDGKRLSIREIASLMGIHIKGVYEFEQAALASLRRGLS